MNDNNFKTKVNFSDEVETRSWCWVSSCRCSLTFSHSWRFPTRPISMRPRIQHLLIQTGFQKLFMISSSNQSGHFNFLPFSGYLSSSLPFYLASLMPASTHKWVGNDVIQLFEEKNYLLENPPDHLHTWRRLQRTILVCFRHFQVHAIAQRCHRFLLLAIPQVLSTECHTSGKHHCNHYHRDLHHHVPSLQWQLLAAVTLDIIGTVAFCKVPLIIIINILATIIITVIIIIIRLNGRATMERFQDRWTTHAGWRKARKMKKRRSRRCWRRSWRRGRSRRCWRACAVVK